MEWKLTPDDLVVLVALALTVALVYLTLRVGRVIEFPRPPRDRVPRFFGDDDPDEEGVAS